jgi:ribosomal protein L18E
MDFDGSGEERTQRAFGLLKTRGLASPGDLVVVVSDVRQDGDIIRAVQVRRVPA